MKHPIKHEMNKYRVNKAHKRGKEYCGNCREVLELKQEEGKWVGICPKCGRR